MTDRDSGLSRGFALVEMTEVEAGRAIAEFLREYPPSGFTYELSTAGHRIDRQNQLVFELEPIGKRRVGTLSKWTSQEEEHRSGNH